jgi:hypothetical protein
MATNLAPSLFPKYLDANGNPLAGGKLYSYQAGTSTPQATYTDSTGSTPNANPVIFDANGDASVWLDPALSYKFVLKDSNDVTIRTVDNVVGLLNTNSVATSSIQDSAVTTAKIADDGVTADKLADHATIDANRAVTTNHVRDGAITPVKLSDAAKGAQVLNLGLTASVASNALTVALKGADGNNPSSTNPVYIAFRSSTAATGTPVIRSATAATSVVVSSGSTLGHTSATDMYVYVYAIDNAGTVELAVSSSLFDEGTLVSTTGEGGAGAADSGGVMYSTTARSNVACRLLGRLKSNQATAGTWASSISEIALPPFRARNAIAYVTDQQSNGTNGGASSAGSQLRVLNTVSDPDGIGVTLSLSQFTLPAGKYRIRAHAPAYGSNRHKIKLRNVTDGADAIIGTTGYSLSGANATQTDSHLCGVVSITTSKAFGVYHYTEVAQAANGLGTATSWGTVEIYAHVEIERLS